MLRSIRSIAVVAATSALALTGCSSTSSKAPQSGGPTTAAGCPAAITGMQKGFDVLWRQADASAGTADHIAQYATGLGANAIAIAFPLDVNGNHATSVFAGPTTPTPAGLTQLISAAKHKGLYVLLRPYVNETDLPGSWRGAFDPPNPSEWLASYGKELATYAGIAKQTCVDEIAIGVELNQLQSRDADWQVVSHDVRAAGFSGRLTYAANFDQPKAFSFLDRPAIDFYPRISGGQGISAASAAAQMVAFAHTLPATMQSGLEIQETGLSVLGGTFAQPWLVGTGSTETTAKQQAVWFDAACQAAKQIAAGSLYFWVVTGAVDPLSPAPGTQGAFGFQGRPAEAAAKACFTSTLS